MIKGDKSWDYNRRKVGTLEWWIRKTDDTEKGLFFKEDGLNPLATRL